MRLLLTALCCAFLSAAILSNAGFAPTKKEERLLVRCLSSRRKGCLETSQSRRHKREKYCECKVSGSATEDDSDLEPAKEYLCALNDYQNTARTSQDAQNAFLDAGSCGRYFPSVKKTLQTFAAERGGIIRIHPTDSQYRNGSSTTVGFIAGNSTIGRSTVENLKAVDLIFSRSDEADVEVYGKYALMVAIQKESGEKVTVHKSLQATCPSEQKRFFVAGMNDAGSDAVSNWLRNARNRLDFIVDLKPLRQIVEGSSVSNDYLESSFDVGQKVSAIVLHFSGPSNGAVPLPSGMIYPPARRHLRRRRNRKTRSLRRNPQFDCHRERFVQEYRNNRHVLRPVEFDLGECVGSCDRALTSPMNLRLNASNHAVNMLWEGIKKTNPTNPDPTVCCIPISYRKFHYVTLDDFGILMSTYADNMVTEYCGCR